MEQDELFERLSTHLATNLRYVRQQRRLTQAQLAKLSGIPRSTLANLETGGGNPTLAVLGSLAASLQLTLEELLSAPRAVGRVYPKGSLPIHRRGTGGQALVAKLLPDPIPGMEIDRMEIPRNGRVRGVPHRPGTREYLYCERGEVELWSAGERFELSTGDVCAFQGDQPHSYVNVGEDVAILMGVVTISPA